MRDLSKNDPARMVRYVRRFGHLWLAQRHPKPSLADVVGLVTVSIEPWHVGSINTKFHHSQRIPFKAVTGEVGGAQSVT